MDLPSVLNTAVTLPFLDEDVQTYPWLRRRTRCYHIGAKIGAGVYGTTYRSYPCDELGERLAAGPSSELVIKIPNVQREYLAADGSVRWATDDEVNARLVRVRQKNCQDFFHIRKRLSGCEYANPSLDLGSLLHEEGKFELPVTVQQFLEHCGDLDDWLLETGIRRERAIRHPDGTLERNWYGIPERERWVEVALQLACAISDIHHRRVTHADIHPGNVFLRLQPTPRVTLIDFGEAFLATPGRNWRLRNPNPYLAPERVGPRFLLTESVDVYSFGILLLYLATGRELLIPSSVRVGSKRKWVYEEISKSNPSLLGRDEPRIVDVIGRSISTDPADRPRMTDICDDLRNIQRSLHSSGASGQADIRQSLESTLLELVKEIRDPAQRHNPVLMRLLDRQARQLSTAFHGLRTEMVELSGTRDQLIRSMAEVFEYLQQGDSWTAATTLAMWQRSALGLDGTYASANIRALKRGAAVRRVFVISVEELGREYCEALVQQLRSDGEPALERLATLLEKVLREDTGHGKAASAELNMKVIEWHRERFIRVLDFVHRMKSEWDVPLAHDEVIDIESSAGLYFGICPVATLDQVGEVREDNPVSLLYLSRQEPRHRWLLVATEAQGRKENPAAFDEPRLLGVRVYQSVQSHEHVAGIPVDRKARLLKLIRASASLASVTGRLAGLASKTAALMGPGRSLN